MNTTRYRSTFTSNNASLRSSLQPPASQAINPTSVVQAVPNPTVDRPYQNAPEHGIFGLIKMSNF